MQRQQGYQKIENNYTGLNVEEGTIAEKTSYVENLNKLIAHINHVAVYPSMGSYVEGVFQLESMLEAYKDKRYEEDYKKMQEVVNKKMGVYAIQDRSAWYEENAQEIARLLFKILMKLMARSGFSPTGRISSIDGGETI